MKVIKCGVGLAVVAFSSASCGGGGVSGPPIPFGHYLGVWNAPGAPDGGENGTADIVVASDGTITGTVTSSVYGPDGTARGFILSNGRTSIDPVWDVNGTGIGWGNLGTLRFSSPDKVRGTLERNFGDFDVPVTWELTLQP